MQTLAIIDDEPGIGATIQQVLAGEQLKVVQARTRDEALRVVREESPDVALLDIRLGPHSGLELFSELHEIDSRMLVIFITGHGTSDTAIEAMKIGAFDYLVKPLDLSQLQQTVEQALRISHLMRLPAAVDTHADSLDTSDRLVGGGAAMQSICKQIGRIAPQEVNVLVLGESGTGKELVARAIYHHSRRNQGPFLAINCAAIPEMLLESELFGHEKGAFTGADRQRIGKFEQCHHGTIFLDEVGDMPTATQAKILRLLQDGQFQRVGGNETLTANVRIIAATNQDLEAMIQHGKFRRDLYYRLRGVTLHLPPLRDRIEDIPELAYYFLFRMNRQLGTTVTTISNEAFDRLQRHNWPGNVRELQSVIREALIASTGPTLLPDFLPIDSREYGADAVEEPESPTLLADMSSLDWNGIARFVDEGLESGQDNLYRRAIEHFDRLVIQRAMQYAGGLQSRAATLLGISRPTLRAKLRVMQRQKKPQEIPATE